MLKIITLDVFGMTCGSCARHVAGALEQVPGVVGVNVLLEDGKVVVQHQPDQVSAEDLVQALFEAGYESRAAA